MIIYFLAVITGCGIVEGCRLTDYKHVGESCSCSDTCLGKSYCQRYRNDTFVCQCLPCQYYDTKHEQCVNMPGFGESCTEKCSSNFVCDADCNGGYTCQCSFKQEYDNKTGSCLAVPTTTPIPTTVCVNSSSQMGCVGLSNGDFQACFPECQKGIYITCTNGYVIVRECALGWYVKPNGERFTEKMVYHASYQRCEGKAGYCPRPLDNQIEQKK